MNIAKPPIIPAPQATVNNMQGDFVAPWWARNCHVQTVFPRFFQRRHRLPVRSQRLELPDGDFVDLAWAEKPAAFKGIAALFHGLEGSVRSHYANDMMQSLQAAGWWPVMMHFRGCSGSPNRLARAYHSGDTGDAWFFLNRLQQWYPGLPKVAVGFSLGANMLLKLLAEKSQQHILRAAVAISAPFDLAVCAEHIGKGFSRHYQHYLLKSAKQKLLDKLSHMPMPQITLSKAQIKQLKDFAGFDHWVTAPLHGFSSGQDYYAKCSSRPLLHKITTPSLILHAKDDPFMHPSLIPAASELSPALTMRVSEHGGHVGFMQGSPWRPRIWTHRQSCDFLAAFAD